MSVDKIAILYASQTGVAKSLAELLFNMLSGSHCALELDSFDNIFNVEDLTKYRCIIFVCSSTGQGDPPDSASKFYRQLRRLSTVKSTILSKMRYTVLGLGDSNYQTFGAFPKALNKLIQNLGGTTFYESALADDAVGLDTIVEPWLADIGDALNKELNIAPSVMTNTSSSSDPGVTIDANSSILVGKQLLVPETGWKLPTLPPTVLHVEYEDIQVDSVTKFSEKYYEGQQYFGTSSPVVFLPIHEIAKLTSPSAEKDVYEICLNASSLPTYSSLCPGDSFSILCVNDEAEVNRILDRLELTDVADKPLKITPKTPSHLLVNDIPITLKNCLLFCVDLRSAPKKSFLRVMASSCCCSEKVELEYLSSFEGSSDFSLLIREAQLSILDLLLLFPTIKMTASQLLDNLPPLKPRSYSVANCPLSASSAQVRFAFSVVHLATLDSKRQYDRYGVCTKFLLNAISKHTNSTDNHTVCLPVFTRTNQAFRFPQELSAPIFLVSAGTGIAPYIGFLEYVEKVVSTGSAQIPRILLFHGCRNREEDFIYKEKIGNWANKGYINKVVLACSRQDALQSDGSRTYVQHKLLEHEKELMELEQPAVIYVCGDAARMAPLLRETLVTIISNHQQVSREEGLTIFKQWTKSGRYKEDVWR